MNAIGGVFKGKKKGNHRKQILFVVGGCEHFQSFGIHNNMNVKNVIEKLQRIAKEKESQISEHK
jgi:hypothetical protein